MSLLAVEELRVRLQTPAGLATVVDGIDYTVEPGEVFGVAGESGSGKTVSMLALLGLLPDRASVAGSARFGGRELIGMPRRRLRSISGRELTMVFQDPFTSLHPMLSIGRQLTEHVRRHLSLDRRAADKRAVELLREVRIPDPQAALHAFPHQFSGGMRQRIAIAIALACEPKLLIADEPTTALDVTVQAGILRLLDRLRREHELAVVLITHDLGVLSSIADRVAIFYAGRVVEAGRARGRAPAAAAPVHARAARRAPASGGRRQAARGDRRCAADSGPHSGRLLVPSAVCLRAGLVPRRGARARARRIAAASPARSIPSHPDERRARAARTSSSSTSAAAARASPQSRART